jgi:hypothetical protein
MSAQHESHHDETMTIRLLADRMPDASALQRLAERDGALLPTGPVLGAWVGGQLLAAVSLSDDQGGVVADPFEHSAGAASVLASRAEQMRTPAYASSRGAMVSPAEASCSQ